MLVRYLPLIFVLAALALMLAPLEAAGQLSTDTGQAAAPHKADKPRPKSGEAPVNANAGKTPLPPNADPRSVRPAEAFPPERIAPPDAEPSQSPQRGGVRTPDPATKDDPRSVEERPDPGG
jgi:hypothetical protein